MSYVLGGRSWPGFLVGEVAHWGVLVHFFGRWVSVGAPFDGTVNADGDDQTLSFVSQTCPTSLPVRSGPRSFLTEQPSSIPPPQITIRTKTLAQEYDDEGPRSPVSSLGRSSRWSIGSGNGPPAASAPRSVWVPGKDGQKNMRLVDFSLPPWAGIRTSCGCLSHTELVWGREGLAPTGGTGGGGMAAGLAAALGIGNSVRGLIL